MTALLEDWSWMVNAIVDQKDYATVGLITFLLAMAIHHLMVGGTLRRIKAHDEVYKIVKGVYKNKMRAVYASISLGSALVGMYFMHLKFERLTLGMIALTPLILCVFLILMLLPDIS